MYTYWYTTEHVYITAYMYTDYFICIVGKPGGPERGITLVRCIVVKYQLNIVRPKSFIHSSFTSEKQSPKLEQTY